MAQIRISVFESTTSVEAIVREASWEEMSLLFTSHSFDFASKLDAPMFSPAEFKGPRSKVNAVRAHFGVIDIDKQPEDRVVKLIERLRNSGRSFVFYTTWSHHEYTQRGLVGARLVFPFDRPVESWEWDEFWPRMNKDHDDLADPKCKPLSMVYYLPSAPAGTEDLAIVDVNYGKPYFVGGPAKPTEVKVHTRHISVSDLQAILKDLKHARAAGKVWFRSHLHKLISGESLAEPGERDDTLWKLACCILDERPSADPDKLAALFAPSLQVMALEARDCPTVANIADKIRRKQQEKAEDQVAATVSDNDERKRMIRMAFDLQERDWPYTPQELAEFSRSLDCGVEDLRQFWIIQKDASYYVFVAGRYRGPFTFAEVEKAAQQYLAPAHSAGVELYTMSVRGDIYPKDAKHLVRDYGTLAQTVYVDMTAQRSYYDRHRRVIVEAPCPMRVSEPVFSPEVDKWMRLLGGEQASKLVDWLSVATKLDEPCAAVYLDGMKDVGKSLFAEGVARLWTDRGSVALADAMSAWNSTITGCPLIFADEAVPKDFRGMTRTGELRAFIQARTRTLKRKFLADAIFRGCIRLVLAANNSDLISTGEQLTVNDIEAITDRVLHIDCTQAREARDYLKSLGKQRVRQFVEEDEIAKHALWLRDNHVADTSHRFLVAGDRSRMHRRLTTSSGLRSAVCNWLVAYLLEPQKIDATGSYLVRVSDGALYANVRALSKHWQMYETNVDPPQTGALSNAISGLSTGEKKQFIDGQENRTWYWKIDQDNLVAWAEDSGYASKENIEKALSRNTKTKSTTK